MHGGNEKFIIHFDLENLKGRDHLLTLCVNWRIILNWS